MCRKSSHKQKPTGYSRSSGEGAKVVKRNYHVTSQTAYHISKLAMANNTSEGRIIDKIMRTYLATQGNYN